jgi:drug/metabolite transporter (DMT)-like permease
MSLISTGQPSRDLADDPHVAAVATAGPNANSKPRTLLGLTMGLLAAAIGALYAVYATYGLARGLKSADMTFLRTSVAGILTLPVFVYYLRFEAEALTGQWRRWLAVALLAGPLFGELVFTAFQFAPPSHGAVFPFAAMSVVGTIFAAVFLKDPLTQRKLLGIGIVIVGLLTLSGVSSASLTGRAGIGDVLFIVAGSLWAGFGVVMRKFRLDPVLATTAAGVFGLATYVPFYLATEGIGRLASADGSLLGIEVLVQGVLAGAGTIYTYARAVQYLGAARAAVFPALVPGLATLMGWPVLGHIPTLTEAIGLTLAIVGLLITVTRGAPADSGNSTLRSERS